eukprot:TRINITY_DN12574_c0_g1_i1.p1 TRINITY_DN12574_c0_g1~~TRINITY_DN12574_c0_g1_i1.p1  ORF type:complete len:386 (-),score=71.34 TRINITY_DN12574_c0_g1_i1:258-1415(-)
MLWSAAQTSPSKFKSKSSLTFSKYFFPIATLLLIAFFLYVVFSSDSKKTLGTDWSDIWDVKTQQQPSNKEEVSDNKVEIRLIGRKLITEIDEWDWGDLPDKQDYSFDLTALKTFPFIVAEATTDPPLKLVVPWWDPQVSNIIQVGGKYQATPEMKFYKELLEYIRSSLTTGDARINKMGPLIVDVGAELGHLSLIAVSLGFRSISYEDFPSHSEKFRMSIALNKFDDRITLVEAAVSDEIGDVEITVPNNPRLGYYSGRTLYSEMQIEGFKWKEVQMTRADYSVEWLTFMDDIQLLRIWAAGHELKALKGSSNLFKTKRVKSVLLRFWPEGIIRNEDDPMSVLEYLTSMGFVLSERFNQERELERVAMQTGTTDLYWVQANDQWL